MYDILVCIKNKDAKWHKSSCHVVSIYKVYNRKGIITKTNQTKIFSYIKSNQLGYISIASLR